MAKNGDSERLLIEIEDLCRAFGIGKNTAYSLLTSGEIDAFKIGTVWKIPMKSVEAYMDRKCEQHRNEMCTIIQKR